MHELFVDIKQKSVIAGWLILWAPYLINGKGVGTCYTYIYLFVDWKKECINLSKLSDDAWYYTQKTFSPMFNWDKIIITSNHFISHYLYIYTIDSVMKYQKQNTS